MKKITVFHIANELIELGISNGIEMPLTSLQKYIFLCDFSLFCKYKERIIIDGIAMGKFGPLYSTFINTAHVYQNRNITNLFFNYKTDNNGYILTDKPVYPKIIESDIIQVVKYVFFKFKDYSKEELMSIIDNSPYLPAFHAKDNQMIYNKHFQQAYIEMCKDLKKVV